jgi:hypothetical protein
MLLEITQRHSSVSLQSITIQRQAWELLRSDRHQRYLIYGVGVMNGKRCWGSQKLFKVMFCVECKVKDLRPCIFNFRTAGYGY